MAHRLASVFAHPDDETFSNAGTLAMARNDIEYTLVVVSSGEDGPIADPSLATRENLAEVREAEQLAALEAVGVKDPDVHFLRYPDGRLKELDREELIGGIAQVLKDGRPQVVVTFGPEGITAHDDHITVGQATTEAFHRLQSAAGSDGAFQRLFYVAIPASRLAQFWDRLRERGADVPDPEAPFVPRGVPDHTITCRVDCSSVVDRKIRAIKAHRTQQVDLDYLPEEDLPEVMGEECFVMAWPPVTDPNGPVLSSLFEGLEDPR